MTNQICLIDELHKLFLKRDVNIASRWEALFGKLRGSSASISNQMLHINSFWRLQIGLLKDQDTFMCRQAIVDDIDLDIWLRNYELYVLPTIVKNNLPNMEAYGGRFA